MTTAKLILRIAGMVAVMVSAILVPEPETLGIVVGALALIAGVRIAKKGD